MALNIIQGYIPSTVEPIDSRFVRADQAARYAINAFDAYDGLVVYQSDTKQLYVLVDKTNIGNSTGWQTIQNSASASAAFPFTGSAQITGSLGLTGSMVQGSGSVASGLNSYAHGLSVTARGDYSRAEGTGATTGITGAYSASVNTNFSTFSSFTMSAAYGNITSSFTSGNDLYTYNVLNEYIQIIPVSRSYYVAPNTIIESNKGAAYSGRTFIVNFSTGITNGLGDQTIPANYSHAEGRNTLTVGNYSHAEGFATDALGNGSHAEGGRTEARGNYSHAEGYETDAYGDVSHAEGFYSAATGEGSHVEGYISLAQGDYSHAEGESCITIAGVSHAEGSNTITYGYASHAEGVGTVAVDSYQHVQGIYNLPVSGAGAFILGNGNVDTQIRSNLIYASGSRVEITGSLMVSSSLTTQGARTRKYRTVTLTDSDWSTGPTKGVQSDDDIIIITDNTTTTPSLGEANFDLSNLLSSPAGRCVEIIKIVDGGGGGIRVASNNGGSISLTLNEVLSANGRVVCANVGQSVTIMSIGSSDAGYAWGNGW